MAGEISELLEEMPSADDGTEAWAAWRTGAEVVLRQRFPEHLDAFKTAASLSQSFAVTREAFGEPSSPVGYVATAVGPDRRARAEQGAGGEKTLGPISVGRLVQLVRFAAHGPAEDDERLFDAKAADGTRYVLEVRHVKGGAAWEFLAWKD